MDDRLKTLLNDIRNAPALAPAEFNHSLKRARWLVEATEDGLAEFLLGVLGFPSSISAKSDHLLRVAFDGLAAKRRQVNTPIASESTIAATVACYRHLGNESTARPYLLAWLALGLSAEEVKAVVDQLVTDPPQQESALIPVLSPLFRRSLQVEQVFPKLLEAMEHPLLTAPVLDLANYVTREKLVLTHPATERKAQLFALLGNLAQTLGQIEENPLGHAESPAELSQRVASSVSLAVALCDAAGQIGDEAAAGKLHQTMRLKHRRLRTEAAAALARLRDPAGIDELKRMAAEPVARLRALSYAQELGLRSKIEPQYLTPLARAEAELVAWLAEPTQFGIPPTSVELVDERRQFWPGYSEPVPCFLFRFTYQFEVDEGGARTFSNVGIVGPLVHAFTADLADLPPHDIYAVYAGWQAEHEEIREYDVARLSKSEQLEIVRLTRRLHDAGYEEIEPQQMGYFFGDKALVAIASRGEVKGVAVVDFDEIVYFPERPRRPLGVREAYSIYKGRKLLKAFNAEKG
jgi:hypothetical protein